MYFVWDIKHLFYIIFCDFNLCGPQLTAEIRLPQKLPVIRYITRYGYEVLRIPARQQHSMKSINLNKNLALLFLIYLQFPDQCQKLCRLLRQSQHSTVLLPGTSHAWFAVFVLHRCRCHNNYHDHENIHSLPWTYGCWFD